MCTKLNNKEAVSIKIQNELLNATNVWFLFIFLGLSYGLIGKPLKQILYYITLGGLGIWFIYLLFNLNRIIREYNKTIYEKYC